MRKTTVSTTTLTEKGFWGAILFVGGPTAAGVLYANIIGLSVSGGFGASTAIQSSALGMGACGFAGLLGFVLLLTGRRTVTELRVIDEKASADEITHEDVERAQARQADEKPGGWKREAAIALALGIVTYVVAQAAGML